MALDETGKAAVKKAFEGIAPLIKADDDAKDAADILHGQLHSVYQVPFRGGLTKGEQNKATDITTLTAERDKYKGDAETLATKVTEIERKNPDAAAVRAELEGKINAERDGRKADRKEFERATQEERMNTARAMVRLLLETKYGIKSLPANYMVSIKDFEGGIRFDPKTGKPEVLSADGVAEQLAAGVDAYDHYAKRLAEKATPDDKRSTAGEGSGQKPPAGDKKGGATGADAKWDNIRNEVKEQEEKKQNAPDLGERLRGGMNRDRASLQTGSRP